MVISFRNILAGGEYTPDLDNEYEISPGVLVKLKTPTIGLREEYMRIAIKLAEDMEKLGDAEAVELGTKVNRQVAVLVSSGKWHKNEKDDIPEVIAHIAKDFYLVVSRMNARQVDSQQEQEEVSPVA